MWTSIYEHEEENLWRTIRHGGTQWCSWLRHCATSRKVMGSIPDGVTGIFHLHPSGCTIALGLTQPQTEMSTRNNSWGLKAAGAYSWQPCHLHVLTVSKSGSLNLLEPYGPVQACNGIALPLPFTIRYVPSADTIMASPIFCLLHSERHGIRECQYVRRSLGYN
jgi:hypothetical protein